MRAYVAVTDGDWFRFLRARADAIEEVNFWQPGGQRAFTAIEAGQPFLFKLHSPDNYIVGGGFFAWSTLLPAPLAWETFGPANGASSLDEMRARIEQYRRSPADPRGAYQIGCILLQQPFFFEERDWIPIPPDWSPNIVQGKTYDLSVEPGRELWRRAQTLLLARAQAEHMHLIEQSLAGRRGYQYLAYARLGQGTFRVAVLDSYSRRCAITGERTVPALEAAHIRPYSRGGVHQVTNGLLLRRDIHTLFDLGYVTVTPKYEFRVSGRIREEYENGREYYALAGRTLRVPEIPDLRPDRDSLQWHSSERFLG